MPRFRSVRFAFLALVAVSLLCAWSYESTAPISIRTTSLSHAEAISNIAAIGKSLAYQKGRFAAKNGDSQTLVEDDKQYRLYFVSEEFRTSFEVTIDKPSNVISISFAEFGARRFTPQGANQYRLLIRALVTSFGGQAVEAAAANDTPGL
ncbi:MAG: hypothetical protein HYU78_09010 [Rhodocyclales bacterium]|nr:hypothetical protein [Rhodocyclales bacterium]